MKAEGRVVSIAPSLNKLKINIPELATKQLKLQKCKAGKKLTISSNWLVLFGFSQGCHVVEELIGVGQGMRIRLANENDTKFKLVYQREYNHCFIKSKISIL